MNQIKKMMAQVGLITALIASLLILMGVISSNDYSLAAQAQARGDLVLIQRSDAAISKPAVATVLLSKPARQQVITQ